MTVDEEYSRTEFCTYKGRNYLVRDNGAILRCAKDGCFPGKNDEEWTFGTKDLYSGYMIFAGGVRVHRVVCTAFHGPEPFPQMVVDHIDTNRCNNRPENLRWLTRLENVLNNEVTRKKIIFLCGSIEAFLENPSILQTKALPPDISWMRTVTKQEAEYCKVHMEEWAKKDNTPNHTDKKKDRVPLGEYIFTPDMRLPEARYSGYISSLGPRPYLERINDLGLFEFKKWPCRVIGHTELSLFPMAPSSSVPAKEVMEEYKKALSPGNLFLISRYFETAVTEVVTYDEGKRLRVLSERQNADRIGWYVFEIWEEEGVLYHHKIGSFFKRQRDKAEIALRDRSVTGWVGDISCSFLRDRSRGYTVGARVNYPLPKSLQSVETTKQ